MNKEIICPYCNNVLKIEYHNNDIQLSEETIKQRIKLYQIQIEMLEHLLTRPQPIDYYFLEEK